mmetsp:Transcript_23433/g.44500  ORF Transcript_23433/g.44500 Transcript_23433/m.44500 type:complete len:279 (+) Transcript_23433:175-1011(+)
MSAPSLSGISLLPALSVVLGLPLCHSNNSAVAAGGVGVGDNGNGDVQSTDCAISSSSSSSSSASDGGRSSTCAKIKSTTTTTSSSSSSSARQQKRQEEFAQRAKNNASRIYARRVINRARLERQHPWASSSSSSSSLAATGRSTDCGRSASVAGVVGVVPLPSEEFDDGVSVSFDAPSPSRPSDSLFSVSTTATASATASSSPSPSPMSLAPGAEERISSRAFASISPRVVSAASASSIRSVFAMDVSSDSSTAISISLWDDNFARSSVANRVSSNFL